MKFPRKLSYRTIEGLTGVSKSTICRIEQGYDIKLKTAKALLPVLEKCPCCGAPTNKERASD